ncbi:plakophilin-3-like [Pristis pectinata]|uniref:plakophilin-3-like n=1 Tax=Pristis pectinata TaxID=685728 RepID=UPI00223CCB11|nr:plakophilin-3-like [Pristis pectinata]
MYVMQETHFLKSALPTDAPVSTLAVPSESQLDHRNGHQQRTQQKSMRVQEQVMTMLKNSSGRAGGSSYAGSVHGGSGGMTRYQTTTMPGFSSKSQVPLTEKKYSTVKPSVYRHGGSQNWSSRSAVGDYAFKRASGASQYDRQGEEVVSRYRSISSHQTNPRPMSFHQSSRYRYATLSQLGQQDSDNLSLRSLQLPGKYAQKKPWSGSQLNGQAMYQRPDDEEISMISDQVDNGYMSGGNEYGSRTNYTVSKRMSIGGSVKSSARMSSGSTGMAGYAAEEIEETSVRRQVRPPAQRTLQRVQQCSKVSRGRAGSSSQISVQMSRTPSLHSLTGMQAGAQELGDQQMQQLQMDMNRFQMSQTDVMNLPTAVQLLSSHDVNNQVIGAGYIQHTCYHDANAKTQAYNLNAIQLLVKLFNHDALEVQRSATAAMRNLIYNNNVNKLELVKQNGIPKMMQAIRVKDEELKANITGILWNLSSNEDLKNTLAQGALDEVTQEILSPYSGWSKSINEHQLPSEDNVFFNTTGYIRNLSSGKVETRQKMRQCKGLVDSLVYYIQHCLDVGNTTDKSLENSACVLRNLSYRLYEEIPSYYQNRLEGPGRNDRSARKNDVVGCFTPQSRKVKEINTDMAMFSEVSKNPKGMEWLWNPAIVKMYSKLLEHSECNLQTTEAALGALQNITAGDCRWASVVSRLTMDQDRTWFTLIDYLKNNNENVLKALTGLLRNLTIHAKNKEDVSIKIIGPLLNKLPEDVNYSSPSNEVAANICSILNSLVIETSEAPRQIVNHNGLRKIMNIKERRDSESEKAAKAASSLLGNMWYYKSMHREYRSRGFVKNNFVSH